MPKFYVSSGTLNIIISCENSRAAAVRGLMQTNKFDTIDEYFYVDERGYRDYVSADPNTDVIATKSIVRAAGWRLSNNDDEA